MNNMKKLKDINWNQVYYFYEVARKKSMKEAAEVSGVSIPTVSEQIKRLEELLDTPLFFRRPRRLELTPEGATLFVYASQMFEAGLRFLDSVSSTSIGGYPVRVLSQKGAGDFLSTDFLLRYATVYEPFGVVHTQQALSAEAVEAGLEKGDADWGLTWEEPQSAHLNSRAIASAEIVLAVANTHWNANDPLAVLAELPVAVLNNDQTLRKWLQETLEAKEITIEEWVESDHTEFCSQLALAGQCLMMVPRSRLFPGGPLRELPLGHAYKMTAYAVWSPIHQKMVAIKKLVELLGEPDITGSVQTSEPILELPH